ncbi:MAG: hypothetical protein KME04_11235 [Pleurocapsa minor GSE-CHR-MK-17-07R]|nr:hypothetical protein [Pleurocapsa minor GSE-CHR-MK 17-07R]
MDASLQGLISELHRLCATGAMQEAMARVHLAWRQTPRDPGVSFLHALLTYRTRGGSQNAFYRALPDCRDALDHADASVRSALRTATLDDPFYRPLAEALFEK